MGRPVVLPLRGAVGRMVGLREAVRAQSGGYLLRSFRGGHRASTAKGRPAVEEDRRGIRTDTPAGVLQFRLAGMGSRIDGSYSGGTSSGGGVSSAGPGGTEGGWGLQTLPPFPMPEHTFGPHARGRRDFSTGTISRSRFSDWFSLEEHVMSRHPAWVWALMTLMALIWVLATGCKPSEDSPGPSGAPWGPSVAQHRDTRVEAERVALYVAAPALRPEGGETSGAAGDFPYDGADRRDALRTLESAGPSRNEATAMTPCVLKECR